MPKVAVCSPALAGRLTRLAREARAVADRRRRPVLVWVSMPEEGAGPGWALPADGWVFCRPSAQARLWAAGRAWAVELAGTDRFRAAADAWRRVATDALAEGPLPPVALTGFAFAAAESADPWRGFPQGLVVVPRVLRVRLRGAEYLAASCVVGPEAGDEDVSRTVRALESVQEEETPGGPPEGQVVWSWPAEKAWQRELSAAEAACRSGVLQKVVLARCVEVATRARPGSVLQALAHRYPTCTSFAVCTGGSVFLGATPETLVRVRGGRVWAQALAGTAPRGADPEHDQRLREQLRTSPKEAREHELVASHVQEALTSVCTDVRRGGRGVLLLPNVQHLRTVLSGDLREDVGLLEVAGRLHPTPAVAGLPVAAATGWIGAHESVPRGWYAGLVGWTDASGNGTLWVAIRSALVQQGRAWAFAGCGVVAGSEPHRELAESQLKLRPILEALGVAGR